MNAVNFSYLISIKYYDSQMKTAREAWEKIKTVDSMVTLFHRSLRHDDEYYEYECAKCDGDVRSNHALFLCQAIGT